MNSLRTMFDSVDSTDLSGLNNTAKVYRPSGAFPARIDLPIASADWEAHISPELFRLQTLQDGWDGYNSPPVDPQIAHYAKNILIGLYQINQNSRILEDLAPPFLVPISGGALQAEWHFDNMFIEIFFDSDHDISASFYTEGCDIEQIDESHELEIKGSSLDASQLVEWFNRVKDVKASHPQAAWSYARKLVMVFSGGILKLLDTVFEFNPFYDFRHSVCPVEFAPFGLR